MQNSSESHCNTLQTADGQVAELKAGIIRLGGGIGVTGDILSQNANFHFFFIRNSVGVPAALVGGNETHTIQATRRSLTLAVGHIYRNELDQIVCWRSDHEDGMLPSPVLSAELAASSSDSDIDVSATGWCYGHLNDPEVVNAFLELLDRFDVTLDAFASSANLRMFAYLAIRLIRTIPFGPIPDY